MRATSTMRVGEVRRGGAERKLNPKADPRGDLDEASNWDNFRVAPGETHVLLDEQGPGVITHIWVTFLGPGAAGLGRPRARPTTRRCCCACTGTATRARRSRPRSAISSPTASAGAARSISLPVIVEDADSYNCFWHMPFRKSARIEIENQSDKPISLLYYNIDWIKKDKVADDTPYFYAQYRQEYPVAEGPGLRRCWTPRARAITWARCWPCGRAARPGSAKGDEKIYIDGEAKPSIWGTGTEDYFLSAWGLKTTSTPYFGVPYFDQWGIVGGHTSAYRWHVNDPLVFNTGIKVTLEHFGWISPDENPEYKSTSWNEREDDYASVAFWYQTGESTFAARAPHARERRLPSLERLTVRAADFTERQAPRRRRA